MAHINARSLLANIVEVKLLVSERNIDILCVSETWLLPHTPDSHIYINGYNVFRCDKGHEGGACIYVKDNLTSKVITCDLVGPSGIEDVWISVQCRKLPSIIIGSDNITRKIAIESLALSTINYCLPIYGTANNTLIIRIQRLQNFAAKTCIGGAKRRDHATPFITQLKWLKIDKKIIYDIAINIYIR